jgi:hypothetical protein
MSTNTESGPAEAPGAELVRRTSELRQQLLELDNRFAELGGAGLFDLLDRAGVLEHRLVEAGAIERATREPPPVGRARLRGEFVGRFALQHGTHWCDWSGLWDRPGAKRASLLDPFCSEPDWLDWKPDDPGFFPPAESLARRELQRARQFFESARHAQALEVLFGLQPFWRNLTPRTGEEFLALFAVVQTRCGLLGGTESLMEALRRRAPDLTSVVLSLHVHLYQKLAPHPDTRSWIRRGEEWLSRAAAVHHSERVSFLTAKGCFLNRTGCARDALATLAEATRDGVLEAVGGRLAGRLLAEFAETHRLLGDPRQARRLLVRARKHQRACGCIGDLGHFTLLYRAKLESSPDRAAFWLTRAERRMRECRDSVGELRCCLLRARLARTRSVAESARSRISVLREQLPALAQCSKLAQILERWEEWACGGAGPDANGDFFWGV